MYNESQSLVDQMKLQNENLLTKTKYLETRFELMKNFCERLKLDHNREVTELK